MEQWRFDAIGESRENLLAFFRENFEEVVDLVGEDDLVEQYLNHQKLPLISIKVRPPFLSHTVGQANPHSVNHITTKTAA